MPVSKSVQFNHEQEALLEEAARALGISQSKLIREAITEKCLETATLSKPRAVYWTHKIQWWPSP